MKSRKKLPGIFLIAAGIGLGVVNLFLPGVILVLWGIIRMASGQPSAPKSQPAPRQRQPVVIAKDITGAPAADAYAFSGTPDEYFYRILSNCFPGYNVQRSTAVSSGVSGNQGWGYFLLTKNGAPKAAIVLADKYQWNIPEINDAMNYCRKNRIPCLRFIRQFRNEAGYVIGRIRGILP